MFCFGRKFCDVLIVIFASRKLVLSSFPCSALNSIFGCILFRSGRHYVMNRTVPFNNRKVSFPYLSWNIISPPSAGFDVLKWLRVVLGQNYLTSNGKFYLQMEGLARRSHLLGLLLVNNFKRRYFLTNPSLSSLSHPRITCNVVNFEYM